jgi:ATP-binding cassette subfamily F protein 3
MHNTHYFPRIEIGVSIEEAINRVKNEKRLIKKEKHYQVAEKRFALEREEILQKLSNKPVKIHPRGDRDLGRIKDIKLEGVSMALGSLELLNDIVITFSEGRKYGLIGRNGQGKTTFLKHVAGHAFPGIPKGLQILHIEQEVEISDIAVIDVVLACDVERSALQKESKIITAVMDENHTPDATSDVVVPKTEEEDEFGVLDMTPDERGQRLVEIYNRWSEIDGDKSPSVASTILSGLGFTTEMQTKPIKSFSGGTPFPILHYFSTFLFRMENESFYSTSSIYRS